MPRVIGIRFHGTGKAYHFDPGEYQIHQGDSVIVETVQGVELGVVADEVIDLPPEKLVAPLKGILRLASDEDLAQFEANRVKEKEAFKVCQAKIEGRGLDMHLVDVEYSFDSRKVVFYFTADGRIDFRELVKDLASVFRIRIELRQIGVRDEARMIGGLGICGRELCCCSFLNDFVPVSIKMAKEQNLSMNPAKISGCCGRLLCCLKYEQDAYEDAHARMPRPGHIVMTPEGQGMVEGINLLKETVTVRLDRGGEADLIVVPNDDVSVIGGKPGKKCPHAGFAGSRPQSGAAAAAAEQPAPPVKPGQSVQAGRNRRKRALESRLPRDTFAMDAELPDTDQTMIMKDTTDINDTTAMNNAGDGASALPLPLPLPLPLSVPSKMTPPADSMQSDSVPFET